MVFNTIRYRLTIWRLFRPAKQLKPNAKRTITNTCTNGGNVVLSFVVAFLHIYTAGSPASSANWSTLLAWSSPQHESTYTVADKEERRLCTPHSMDFPIHNQYASSLKSMTNNKIKYVFGEVIKQYKKKTLAID